MNVTETLTEGLKRAYKVTIAADDIAARIDGRLKELQKTANMKGFRPGKVPVQLLKRQFGPSLTNEVIQKTLQDSSGQVISDQGVRPAMQPRIEDMSYDEGKDLEFVIALEILPEIETEEFSGYKVERLTVAVADSEIDEAMDRLLKGSADYVDTDADYQAENGDAARIDFAGRIDGETFEGGTASDQMVELGGGRLLPEIEAGLVGRRAGDTFSLDVTFPDDYGVENLAGKSSVFEITVKEIRKVKPAELNDDFAVTQGAENVADLREKLSERLGQEYKHIAHQRVKRQLLDQLADGYSFEVPPGLVESEFEAIWQQIERELGQNHDHSHDHEGHDHEGHDHDHDHDQGAAMTDERREELREEYGKIAERRVRLGLLLSEIGRQNAIDVTPDDMQQAVINRARQFPGQEAKIVQYYQSNPQAIQELTAPILEDRVIDHILSKIEVSERAVTPEELLKAEQDDADEAAAGDEATSAKPAKKAAAKKPAAKKAAAKKAPAKKSTAKKASAKKAATKKDDDSV